MDPIKNNMAAWLLYEKAPNMEVAPGPKPNPAENEVVIKVAYAAVNPTDWKMQDSPYFKLTYPVILGTDIAGTVVQLGSGVTRFKIGQRVIGHCDSILTQKKTNAGFQLYSTCLEILVAELPDSVPLSSAAVLPLSISTASTGLFKALKLPLPSLHPEPTGQAILIWGGSSSVGSTAIQLAVAAGLTVATTTSPQNHAYAKSLGAAYCFDHKDPDVVEKILKVLKKGDVALDVISTESSQKASAEIINKIGGGKLPVVHKPLPTRYDNVETIFVNGLDPGLVDLDLGRAIWGKYIPQALAAGSFQTKPDPLIIEGGLEKVQDGINILRKGVSAKKVVIEIAKHA
ncbi:putative quinone oxidoreductase [Mollisia scopiformis]|uniref:Putative quinone oxidoreductase n=1 Tax=Mollisia scopiformis TaxID=149040 RepID=A0A194X3W7_MOLSC|nr:putative quinone oxidoreductase [Mollisia scopiformis]KUJ14517.1 putative quinone oxidoreductase [Mollisia scopiformis]